MDNCQCQIGVISENRKKDINHSDSKIKLTNKIIVGCFFDIHGKISRLEILDKQEKRGINGRQSLLKINKTIRILPMQYGNSIDIPPSYK